MVSTTYYWDDLSDNVVLEEDENGDPIAEYIQEPGLYGEAISQERDGQVRYYNYDGLGDTVELTDENQDVTDTYEYSAFGEEIARTGTTENPFRYKGSLGYYTDSEMDDVYVRARTYQPTIARWLSVDPLRLFDLLNKEYVYSVNCPLSYYDPSGAQAKCPPCTDSVTYSRGGDDRVRDYETARITVSIDVVGTCIKVPCPTCKGQLDVYLNYSANVTASFIPPAARFFGIKYKDGFTPLIYSPPSGKRGPGNWGTLSARVFLETIRCNET